MKLNSLIKYNSLKIFSLHGYLFEIYFRIYLSGIHELLREDPAADPEVIYFAFTMFTTRDYLISLSAIVAIIILDFLWKKLKSQNKTEKKYATFVVVLFWIGIIIQILRLVRMLSNYISSL